MLIGLDNAGKTTILSALQGQRDNNITATVGFNRETVKHERYNITYFDLGGGKTIRKIWRKYYASIHAAIFVIDAADESRLNEAKEILHESVKNPFFTGKSLLILANKRDLKQALSPEEIAERLNISNISQYVYRYNIIACSALNFRKKGVDEYINRGLTWLTDCIDSQFEQLNKRVEKESKEVEERERTEKEERMKKIRERKALEQCQMVDENQASQLNQ